MSGKVIADPAKIIEFDDGLRNTISHVDYVLAENEEIIQKTKRKISDVLGLCLRKKAQAYEDLIDAQDALTQAKLNSEDDSDNVSYHYQIVEEYQHKYDEISDICSSVEIIFDDFDSYTSTYRGSIDSLRQNYISLLQKSSYILTQYAELVRRSASIINGASSTNINHSPKGSNTDAPPQQYYQPLHSSGDTARNHPRELISTNQTWKQNTDGSLVFNTPIETGNTLDSCQGKVDGFQGTCGLVSCVNILRLAGYPATENEVVEYASKTSAGFGRGKLCSVNSYPEDNGGTSAKARQMILKHFGINSELREPTVSNIAEAVSEGRGVIISVYAGILYNGWSNQRDLHAITVTSVKKDRYGNILGFYVCDSGTGGKDSSKFYSTFQIENALSGRKMNVTSIIR